MPHAAHRINEILVNHKINIPNLKQVENSKVIITFTTNPINLTTASEPNMLGFLVTLQPNKTLHIFFEKPKYKSFI